MGALIGLFCIMAVVHDVTDFDWENYIKFADKWLK